MEMVTLSARLRARQGRGGARASRRDGQVPAVVYGRHVSPRSVEVAERDLQRLLREHGITVLVSLEIAGEAPSTVLVKDVQRKPVSQIPIHVDFQAVAMDEAIETHVPLVTTGHSPGEHVGGILTVLRHEIPIRCLPADLPEHLTIDLGTLGMPGTLTAADLVAPSGVTVLLDTEETLVACTEPVGEAAEEEAEGAAAETPAGDDSGD